MYCFFNVHTALWQGHACFLHSAEQYKAALLLFALGRAVYGGKARTGRSFILLLHLHSAYITCAPWHTPAGPQPMHLTGQLVHPAELLSCPTNRFVRLGGSLVYLVAVVLSLRVDIGSQWSTGESA